jgi:hypothetical protein
MQMNLGAATNLLEASGKNFSDVYKLYNFRDDGALKDYLDFVIHEPKEWMRGFPKKLKSRGAFAAPKTALIKLLKQAAVINSLGADYVKQVHDTIWQTFKKHGDEIYASRNKAEMPQPIEEYMEAVSMVSEEEGEDRPRLEIVDDEVDAESIHSVRKPRAEGPANTLVYRIAPIAATAGTDWKARALLLENVIRSLAADLPAGTRGAILSLLGQPS